LVGAAVGDFVGAGVVAVSVVKVTVRGVVVVVVVVAALLIVTVKAEESTAITIVSSAMPETEVTEAPTVIEVVTEADVSVKTVEPVVASAEVTIVWAIVYVGDNVGIADGTGEGLAVGLGVGAEL
jgi:hypothetical protein